MIGKEREAFIKAYRDGVGSASDEEVRAFLDEYLKVNNEGDDTLYNKYLNCYTSIVDAFVVWKAAIQFLAQPVPEI